jgi:Virulence factor BrkB
MSLVFTTLLSIVPLLAVSFSVLKAFGVHNQLEPLLLNFLQPLGAQGRHITDQIIGFVDNIQVGVLGALGIALLFYTAISLIQKAENAFNYIWHVKGAGTLADQFSRYFSVIMIVPVLVFAALGVTASLTSTAIVRAIVAIVIGAFTFVYFFIPNTRVRRGRRSAGDRGGYFVADHRLDLRHVHRAFDQLHRHLFRIRNPDCSHDLDLLELGELHLSVEAIQDMLHVLERGGLLSRTSRAEWLPARPMETTGLKEVLTLCVTPARALPSPRAVLQRYRGRRWWWKLSTALLTKRCRAAP